MKYFLGFITVISLFFANRLFGQKADFQYKINFTDANHFTLVADKIWLDDPESQNVELTGKDSTIVIDSFSIVRSPLKFGDIYIICLSVKLPPVIGSEEDMHSVFIYYFDLKTKKSYSYDKSSKRFFELETKAKTRQQLFEEIKNNQNENPHLIIYSFKKNEVNSIRLLKNYLKKLPLLYAVVNTGLETKTEVCSILPKECYWDTSGNNEVNIKRIESYYKKYSKLECFLSYKKLPRELSDIITIINGKVIKRKI